MKFSVLLALAVAAGAAAQEKGQWRAANKTAESVTGDVSFAAEKITIGFASFPIVQIRPLTSAEALALFNDEPSSASTGNIYRVSVPAAQKFQNKNTLCGSDETDWIVSYVSGRQLQLAMFSGRKIPVISAEALANATDLCGVYSYVR